MKRGEIIPPVIIDKATRLIIDGQHRFMAAQFRTRRFCIRVCIWMFTTNPRKRNNLRNGC